MEDVQSIPSGVIPESALISKLNPSYKGEKGKLGKTFTVTVNHFQLSVKKDLNVYRYRFDVLNEKGTEIRDCVFIRLVLKSWSKEENSPIYNKPYTCDYSHLLYSVTPLIEGQEFCAELSIRDEGPFSVGGLRKITVILKSAGNVLLGTLLAKSSSIESKYLDEYTATLQFCNIALRHFPSQNKFLISNSMYSLDDSAFVKALSNSNINLHRGFYTSCRKLDGGLTLNLDVSFTTMYNPGPILPIICSITNQKITHDIKIDSRKIDTVLEFLQGLKINYIFPDGQKRTSRVFGISNKSISDLCFDLDGNEITVKKYLTDKYQCQFKYNNLQCFNTSKVPGKDVWMPIEYASIAERQLYRKKLDEILSRDMIGYTCLSPGLRMSAIRDSYRAFKSPQRLYDFFGINVDQSMISLQARSLPGENIKFSNKSMPPIITPINGGWNLKEKSFLLPKVMDNWHVVVYEYDKTIHNNTISNFLDMQIKSVQSLGIAVSPPAGVHRLRIPSNDPYYSYYEFINCFSKMNINDVKLVLVILPTLNSSDFYNATKYAADVTVGVPTQCILFNNIVKPSPSFCSNIASKLNLKLSGTNYSLNEKIAFVSNSPTMVIGADVCHPSPNDGPKFRVSSVASLVGSVNSLCTEYFASFKPQIPNTESFSVMKEHLIDLLNAFRKKNNILPTCIVFFRDGVSQGDYHYATRVEISSILAAASAVKLGYKPKITYISSNKRHHTVIMPTERELEIIKMKGAPTSRLKPQNFPYSNIPPGTVLDHSITNPNFKNFYIVCHAGIKGTSRPIHYQVLHDDNNIDMDTLQKMVYQLSHLFERATSTVSYVTPVYYAHVVSRRVSSWYTAKSRISPDGILNPEDKGNISSKKKIEVINVHPRLRNRLWYV